MAQQPLIYSTMISDHNSWVFASMWLLVCREKGKGSFCTLGNQRAFHTGISPSIKASSFVINAQDAIKYYTTPLLPLNIYPSLIIIQSSFSHFYFPRIHRNLFLTGIYVVQGLLGLAIIHAGALRTCDPLLLLLLICCISEAIISNLDANSCWLFFPPIPKVFSRDFFRYEVRYWCYWL